MFIDRMRYELRLMGKRVILTPILVMVGFALFAELLHYLHTDPARFLSGGLEIMLPLTAGVVIATITSHDPVIEVQLTVPKLYHLTVLLRLFLIVIWTACIALLSSSALSALKLVYMLQPASPWSAPLQFLLRQLVWSAPLFWFATVGLCLALLTRSRSASGALLCGIWLIEIIFKDFIFTTTWLSPVSLFPTTLVFPSTSVPQLYFNFWLTSRFEVLVMALVLLPVGWLLLHNPEGLLKGSSEE